VAFAWVVGLVVLVLVVVVGVTAVAGARSAKVRAARADALEGTPIVLSTPSGDVRHDDDEPQLP
jgi:hypothetical protein